MNQKKSLLSCIVILAFLSLFVIVIYASAGGEYAEEYGIWFDSATGSVISADEGLTELVIPEELNGTAVTAIGPNAFADSALELVVLPDSVTEIGASAFSGCGALKGITLPGHLTAIGEEAFLGCGSLERITFPKELKTIGNRAFALCTALRSVSLPESVTKLGDGAFLYCNHLSAINVAEENPQYCSVDSVLFERGQTALLQYPAAKNGTVYQIPDGVSVIGEGAFAYAAALKKITFASDVKTVGDAAFLECDGLERVDLSETKIETVGIEAFSWCDQLREAILPDGLREIPEGMFWYCPALCSVRFPQKLTGIGDNAFLRCESLEDPELPAGVKTIGASAFSACPKLKRMILPSALAVVGEKCFAEDSALTQVIVNNGAIAFADDAFRNCPPLTFYTPEHTAAQEYAQQQGSWEQLIRITLQGEPLEFEDQLPVVRNDRTMAPLRVIFEAMGASVGWEEETMTVTSTRGDTTLIMQIDNPVLLKNGESIELDAPPMQINDRTVVPVRAIAESFDCEIDWEEETATVSIWE